MTGGNDECVEEHVVQRRLVRLHVVHEDRVRVDVLVDPLLEHDVGLRREQPLGEPMQLVLVV